MHLIIRIIKVLSKVYPFFLNKKINTLKNLCYTYWLSPRFAKVGKKVLFERRLRLYGEKNIYIGDNVCIRRLSNLSTYNDYANMHFSPTIKIGNNVTIGEFFNISSVNGISISDNVLIGRWVTIIDHNHGKISREQINMPPAERSLYSSGKIIIEENVWISDKVTICANVHIHKGAIIGANSVVTKDIPENAVAVGCPAKIIKIL